MAVTSLKDLLKIHGINKISERELSLLIGKKIKCMLKKNRVQIKVYQHDWMPGYAAFKVGSTKKPHAEIALNLGSLLCAVKLNHIEEKEVPYFIAESLMHEIIHVLEEWAGKEFSHRKINSLMKKYDKYVRGTK